MRQRVLHDAQQVAHGRSAHAHVRVAKPTRAAECCAHVVSTDIHAAAEAGRFVDDHDFSVRSAKPHKINRFLPPTSLRSQLPVIAQKRIRRHVPRPLVNGIERDDVAANDGQLRRQRRPNCVGRAKVVVDQRHLNACENGSATRTVDGSAWRRDAPHRDWPPLRAIRPFSGRRRRLRASKSRGK